MYMDMLMRICICYTSTCAYICVLQYPNPVGLHVQYVSMVLIRVYISFIHFMPLCKTCAHTDACICVCVCVYKWYLQVHTCILGGAMRPRQVPKDVKRYVTISPLGREIVGLFSAAHLKWYQIGFITRLRMGDHSWRPMKRKGDENEVSDYGCASFPII